MYLYIYTIQILYIYIYIYIYICVCVCIYVCLMKNNPYLAAKVCLCCFSKNLILFSSTSLFNRCNSYQS